MTGPTTRMRRGLAATTVLTAIALTPQGAAAATQVGNNCVVNSGTGKIAYVQLAQDPANPFPLTVPAAGVITQWKVTLPVTEEVIPTRMQVYRATANPKQFQTIGDSGPVSARSGSNTFATRIPVQAGDRVGSAGLGEGEAGLVCEGGSAANVVGIAETVPPGATLTLLGEDNELQTPVLATVEPDADNDGYGDETQDKCPQSAAIQATPCPVAVVDIVPLAGRSAVTVLVSSSVPSPVSVSATVPLPGGGKGKAGASAKLTLKKVTHEVTPGKLGRFKLKLPAPLKAALAALPPGRSLKMTVSAAATNVAGIVSKDSAKLRLKG